VFGNIFLVPVARGVMDLRYEHLRIGRSRLSLPLSSSRSDAPYGIYPPAIFLLWDWDRFPTSRALCLWGWPRLPVTHGFFPVPSILVRGVSSLSYTIPFRWLSSPLARYQLKAIPAIPTSLLLLLITNIFLSRFVPSYRVVPSLWAVQLRFRQPPVFLDSPCLPLAITSLVTLFH